MSDCSHCVPLIIGAGATLAVGIFSSAASLAVDEDATKSESSTTLDFKASEVIAACLHSGCSIKCYNATMAIPLKRRLVVDRKDMFAGIRKGH
jgi:hypothetical protein